MADCAGMSLFSKGQRKFFDPSFAGRYAGLGADFANYMNHLGSFSWTTLRWSLVGEFFGPSEPIWSRCGGLVFSEKAASLKSQINALVKECPETGVVEFTLLHAGLVRPAKSFDHNYVSS